MSLFPAILVGGPPHSGKSVLTHGLSMALRKRNIAHYALRAAPDGEGDWSNEMDWPVVEKIRRKGKWTSRWVREVCNAINQRHLPLLVDMGGQPTPEQEAIFDQCNYAILLTRSEEARKHWLALARTHNLTLLADLHSDLAGQNEWVESSDPITGTLRGLDRGCAAQGPAFDALAGRVAEIMRFSPAELWQTHQKTAPWREPMHVLNFDEQPQSAVDRHGASRFTDADIQKLLSELPPNSPVCLYGRAPANAITAVAHVRHVEWLFDVRLGWVKPPQLSIAKRNQKLPPLLPVAFITQREPSAIGSPIYVLSATISHPPLNIQNSKNILLPYLPAHSHVVINGILPYWLLAAIARAYQLCDSVTVYQPRQHQLTLLRAQKQVDP